MSRTRNNRPGQIRLQVRPQHGGAFTRWRLTGSLVTTVPHRELRLIFQKLSFWSGWPVELVLPADAGTAAWFEWWTAAIDATPEDHLSVRFSLTEHPPWMIE